MQDPTEMNQTKHAKSRMQQRCIPPLIVEWLADYGACRYDHRGAEIRFFDKAAKKALSRDVGRQILKQLSKYMRAYIVCDLNGTVITAGHRYKRIRH